MEHRTYKLEVTRLIDKRVGSPVAETCFVDRSPAPEAREVLALQHAILAPGARPSATADGSISCGVADVGESGEGDLGRPRRASSCDEWLHATVQRS